MTTRPWKRLTAVCGLPACRVGLLSAAICSMLPGAGLTLVEAATDAASSRTAADGSPADSPEEKAAKQRTATAMVYIVVGIAVVGLTLIVFVILGGHRIRQRARSRMSRAPQLDPLWYLKPAERAQGNAGGQRPGDERSPPPSESDPAHP
jgi:hypothetical protein